MVANRFTSVTSREFLEMINHFVNEAASYILEREEVCVDDERRLSNSISITAISPFDGTPAINYHT